MFIYVFNLLIDNLCLLITSGCLSLNSTLSLFYKGIIRIYLKKCLGLQL